MFFSLRTPLLIGASAALVSLSIGMPLLASSLDIVQRKVWHAKAMKIDLEHARKPAATTQTIYAEDASVETLFAKEPAMLKKIRRTELRPRANGGFTYLTVHGTPVPAKKDATLNVKMQELQNMVQRGYQVTDAVFSYMVDVPYHYFISVSGGIAAGRELTYSAQTNTPNSPYGVSLPQHLTVVLEQILERNADGTPKLYNKQQRNLPPTLEQLGTLERLINQLADEHRISSSKIAWHSQYANTSCPGADIIAAVKMARQKRADRGL